MALVDALSDVHRMRLVVRHTFLSVVVDDDNDDQDERPRSLRRSNTDSSLCRHWIPELEYHLGSPWTSTTEGSDAASGGARSSQSLVASEAEGGGGARARAPAASTPALGEAVVTDSRTTLMMRNLPNNYTRAMLLSILDAEGFSGCYNFIYLPIDFSRGCGLGYAFVNIKDASDVPKFKAAFSGFNRWALRTTKVCEVSFSDRDQGLDANIKRYRNSPVMHGSVPDAYKPCLFSDGVRIPFPVPTRRLRSPAKKE